jgi:hypothetical protein
MTSSTISSQRISTQGEVTRLIEAPTPVTCPDLFNAPWARAWERSLWGAESSSFSVFLAGRYLATSVMSASVSQCWGSTDITSAIFQGPRNPPEWTFLTTFGSAGVRGTDPAAAFADIVADIRQSVLFARLKAAPDPAQIVSEIRTWADLSAADVAAMIGVSRRSLYHWLGSGRVSSENRERLS